jgi:hypothetical protein
VETTHPEVRLLVPAMPEFIRLARLAAAALASRKGFTYDEVEDLRIAIDELCFTLVGTAGREGVLVLHYSMVPEGLAIEGVGQFSGDAARSIRLSPLSDQILSAVVDEHEVITDGAEGPSFRLLKRHTTT